MFVNILAGVGAVVLSVFAFLSVILFLDWLSAKILGRRFEPRELRSYLYFLPVPLWLLIHARVNGTAYCFSGVFRLNNVVLMTKEKDKWPGVRWLLLWVLPMWCPLLVVSFLKSLRGSTLVLSSRFSLSYSAVSGFSDEEWPEAERVRKEQDQRDKAERKDRGWSRQQQLDYLYGYHACKSDACGVNPGRGKMWQLGWEEAEQESTEEPDGSEK